MKEFADDNFKFDENSRKLSKRVENTVGKGEIAHYEQFLLFSQCFQKACFSGVSKGVIVWEWVKFQTIKDIKINLTYMTGFDLIWLNPLPKDNILDWSELKAFVDFKINVTEKMKLLSEEIKNC